MSLIINSANRLYVQKSVAKEFTAKLVEKVNALKMGGGLDKTTTQGPLVNKSAVDSWMPMARSSHISRSQHRKWVWLTLQSE